jgi:RNA polymerase sigma-70 factor (ECF subfamily)
VLVPTDSELVASIQNGQSDSETALYEKYSARVYYLALKETRSQHDAEDVRAETFLRVLQAIRGNQIRSAEALGSFVLGVTHNVLRELYARRRQIGDVIPAEEAEVTTPSHEQVFFDNEVRVAIQRTISRLKPRERLVLRLLIYEELPSEEVARRVAIAPERVRLVKSRALKHFREIHSRLNMKRHQEG